MAGHAQRRRPDRLIAIVEAAVGLGVVAIVVGRSYDAASTVMFVLCGLAAGMTGYFMVKMGHVLKDETLDVAGAVVDSETEALEEEKMLLLSGLKEFEADAAVGKVDADDYQHLKATAESRALHIIQSLKDRDAHFLQEAEALVSKRLGKRVSMPAPVTAASPPASEAASPPASEAASPPASEAASPPASEAASPPASEAASPPATEAASPPATEPAQAPVAEQSAPKDAAPAIAPPQSAAAKASPEAPGASMQAADRRIFDDHPVTMKQTADGPCCVGCGQSNPAEGAYCIGCGRPRAA